MSKKLIFIALVFTIFVCNAFSQEMGFADSARSKATAGEFTSDSDHVSAKDIFEINRTFFSAGYIPQLTGSGEYANGTMSAFWAMPINKTMTVALAGEYKMNSTKVDSAGETSSDAGGTFPGLSGWITESVYKRELSTESSSFSFRPVFMWNNFGFHYRLSRNNANLVTDVQSVTTIESEKTVYEHTTTTDNPIWEHEIGFAYNAKSFKIYVPLGFTISMNGSTSIKMTNDTASPNTTTNSTTINDDVKMYLNPEFIKPVKLGPMTQFRVGLDMTFRVSGGYSRTTYTNITAGVTTTAEAAETENPSYVSFEPYFNPTFEWKLWQNKITFLVVPTVGVFFSTDGYVDSVDYDYTVVTPYIDVNLATVIKPVDWFEFRTGVKYGMEWENNMYEYSNYEMHSYTFKSIFEVYTGLGFIITDDFFLDIFIQAGQTVDLAANTGEKSISETSLFNINAYGLQLSYRF